MINMLFNHKLSTKLKLFTVIWIMINTTLIALTMNTVWSISDNGTIINQSGSLRKSIYRIALLINLNSDSAVINQENEKFTSILKELHKYSLQNSKIVQQLNSIEQSSKQFIDLEKQNYQQEKSLTILRNADDIVESINQLVTSIETENVNNIHYIIVLLLALVIISIISSFVMLSILNRWIITPLNVLKMGITQIQENDFSVRIETDINNGDEFDLAKDGFNKMAEQLEDLYKKFEDKVKEKTTELEEKNHQLASLYRGISYLYESQSKKDFINKFLLFFLDLTQADAISFYLLNSNEINFDYQTSINLAIGEVKYEPITTIQILEDDLSNYHSKKQSAYFSRSELSKSFKNFVAIPIKYYKTVIGVINLYFNNLEAFSAIDYTMLQLLNDEFGLAIENNRLQEKAKKLAVVEERNLLAQGLHDSIAQSLSFLNLHVQMLEDEVEDKKQTKILDHIHFFKEGVTQLYEDVRELMVNFRTKLDTESFEQSIQEIVLRFKKQNDIRINLVIKNAFRLNQAQKIQTAFILQEALSNVRKHSGADQVDIEIINNQDFAMIIKDNGKGFDTSRKNNNSERHIGMSIMHERAENIEGKIEISSRPGQGTMVKLIINNVMHNQS